MKMKNNLVARRAEKPGDRLDVITKDDQVLSLEDFVNASRSCRTFKRT